LKRGEGKPELHHKWRKKFGKGLDHNIEEPMMILFEKALCEIWPTDAFYGNLKRSRWL